MININTQFYLLRTSKTLVYSTGTGSNQTPKLYTKGSGTSIQNSKNAMIKSIAKRMDKEGSCDDLYELVPIHLTIGLPV